MNQKLISLKYLSPVVACLLVIFGFVYYYFFTPMSAIGRDATILIDTDDNFDSVMAKLDTIATQSSLNAFATMARHTDYDSSVRPGQYVLKPDVCAFTFFRKMRNGQQDPIMLIVPQTRILSELAHKLDGKLLADSASYMAAFTDSAKIASYGFTRQTLAAMIIPNTYDFFWTDPPEKFLDRMAKEYEKFWTRERQGKAHKIGLSQLEVSVLASIVDCETRIETDKPIVAGVYLNRLRKGIKLQADPTVKFAVGDFTIRRILFKHLSVNSPYNTYRNEGLPPGPICIPSISGIDAVLDPAVHDYIFFCASPKFDGTHIFASNAEEHMRNARAYQAALNARNIK